jgi:hypothetical protein
MTSKEAQALELPVNTCVLMLAGINRLGILMAYHRRYTDSVGRVITLDRGEGPPKRAKWYSPLAFVRGSDGITYQLDALNIRKQNPRMYPVERAMEQFTKALDELAKIVKMGGDMDIGQIEQINQFTMNETTLDVIQHMDSSRKGPKP